MPDSSGGDPAIHREIRQYGTFDEIKPTLERLAARAPDGYSEPLIYEPFLGLDGQSGRFDLREPRHWSGSDARGAEEFREEDLYFVAGKFILMHPDRPPVEIEPEAATHWFRQCFPGRMPPDGCPPISRETARFVAWRQGKDLTSTTPEPPALRQPPPEIPAGRAKVDHPPPTAPAPKIDYEVIHAALVGANKKWSARLVRFMAGRVSATHEEILDGVYEGSERAWETIKTLVNRTNNALVDLKCSDQAMAGRLKFKAADLTVVKIIKPE